MTSNFSRYTGIQYQRNSQIRTALPAFHLSAQALEQNSALSITSSVFSIRMIFLQLKKKN